MGCRRRSCSGGDGKRVNRRRAPRAPRRTSIRQLSRQLQHNSASARAVERGDHIYGLIEVRSQGDGADRARCRHKTGGNLTLLTVTQSPTVTSPSMKTTSQTLQFDPIRASFKMWRPDARSVFHISGFADALRMHVKEIRQFRPLSDDCGQYRLPNRRAFT
jgi:DNA-binding transcriptional MocR family regulator